MILRALSGLLLCSKAPALYGTIPVYKWFFDQRGMRKRSFIMRKTKIVCTLGPSTADISTIKNDAPQFAERRSVMFGLLSWPY